VGQRAQTPGDDRPRRPIITLGNGNIGRHQATSGCVLGLIWEQEAAGSNPAILTRFFECAVSLGKQARTVCCCRLVPGGVGGRLCTLAPTQLEDAAGPSRPNFRSLDRHAFAGIKSPAPLRGRVACFSRRTESRVVGAQPTPTAWAVILLSCR
jgi:hypothetical protein